MSQRDELGSPHNFPMSEYLRQAREKLRGAIADIDARLAELETFKTEETQLREHRQQIVVLLGDPSSSSEMGHVTPPPPPPRPGRSIPGRGAVPAASAATASTGIRHVDAANRILAVVARKGPATAADVYGAAGMPKMSTRRLLTELIAAKRLVRTGKTQAVRYSVPGRDAAPAEPEGDRGAHRAARSR